MATLSTPANATRISSHLRPFESPRDLVAVANLVELCFADTLDESGKNYVRRMRAAARSAGLVGWSSVLMKGFVWNEDQRMVGNVSILPFSVGEKRNYLFANVAVHPDFRRQGIARELTAQAIDFAHQRGVHSAWLHVREENAVAVSLYESLGFRERFRRTAWRSDTGTAQVEKMNGVTIASVRRHEWEIYRQWLSYNYPPEVSWQSSFSLDALQPGFWGALYRMFSSLFTMQWSAWKQNRLVGTVIWQAATGSTNHLWLAAPPQSDESALRLLLLHARQFAPSHRPLELDYPAGQSSRAIQEAGFIEQQTLIWMELTL